MNPAILNYLQTQEQGDSAPEEPSQRPSFNPFDSGIKNAIESARVSLGMTDKQQDKALRRSMLTFADRMSQEPRQKGFVNNFGAVARSLSPAIIAHDEVEDTSIRENNALANQILGYQAQDQARQMQLEDRAWKKAQAEQQMAEQRRYHNLMSDYQQQRLDLQKQKETQGQENVPLQGDYLPITNKSELVPYTKAKNAFGDVLAELEDLEKSYNKFREDYHNNTLDSMSPAGKNIRKGKGILSRFSQNKKLHQEVADWASLDSKLKRFTTGAEQKLKGGGNMGAQTLEFFREMNMYPDIEKDNAKTFEVKLKDMREHIENKYKAANLSLKHKIHLDPYQLEEFEKNTGMDHPLIGKRTEEVPTEIMTSESSGNGLVMMQDNEGNQFQIPANEVADAINDGLVPIQQ